MIDEGGEQQQKEDPSNADHDDQEVQDRRPRRIMGKEGYEDEIPPEVVLGALDSHVNRVEQVERVQKPTRA